MYFSHPSDNLASPTQDSTASPLSPTWQNCPSHELPSLVLATISAQATTQASAQTKTTSPATAAAVTAATTDAAPSTVSTCSNTTAPAPDATSANLGLNAAQVELCLERLSLNTLMDLCYEITLRFAPQQVSFCSITNVKSGRCTEDCQWCAQSQHYDTKTAIYDVKSGSACEKEAQHNYERGVEFFSFVASGRKQSPRDLSQLLTTIYHVHKQVPIRLCASLGLLHLTELQELKAHGIQRYHCNLETAPSYFAHLCHTHTQAAKIATLKAAAAAGLELCSGGIIGMGESEAQRLELALTLQQLHIKSIPLNILHPIAGTPLEKQPLLTLNEILRTICIFRLTNANAYLRFAGGRARLTESELNQAIYCGINAAIVGDLLTTLGSDIATDRTRFAALHYALPPIPAQVVTTTDTTASTASHSTLAASAPITAPSTAALGSRPTVMTTSIANSNDCAPRPVSTASTNSIDNTDSTVSTSTDQTTVDATLAAVAHTVATLKSPEQMADRLAALGDDFDRAHLWHPYTSALQPTPACKVTRAYGRTIELADGTKLLDGLSSWWCCVHGYGIESITKAAQEQLAQLPHVMFAGFTHEPAIALGKRLLQMIPCMQHIFYADSGSIAVEVALKMAIQYQRARGLKKKTNFLTVHAGYHGDTWNAMSVCEPQGMHTVFGASLPQRYFAPNPKTPFPHSVLTPLGNTATVAGTITAPSAEATAKATTTTTASQTPQSSLDATTTTSFDPSELDDLEQYLATKEDIAAVILEPIVQGANGMFFYHPDYLNHLRALCDRYGVLLIFDEIATGFGRSGKLFAYEYTNIHPDIMLIGKGLTAGYLTLSAALCTKQVAATISNHEPQVFMHGPTFMANPLACATACASLDYLQSYDYLGQAKMLELGFKQGLRPALAYKCVKEVRVIGAIAAIELYQPLSPAVVSAYCLQLGVWLRPMGNLLYAMPPLTMTATEQAQLIHAMLCLVHIHDQHRAARA